jgi:hypothetical protein
MQRTVKKRFLEYASIGKYSLHEIKYENGYWLTDFVADKKHGKTKCMRESSLEYDKPIDDISLTRLIIVGLMLDTFFTYSITTEAFDWKK